VNPSRWFGVRLKVQGSGFKVYLTELHVAILAMIRSPATSRACKGSQAPDPPVVQEIFRALAADRRGSGFEGDRSLLNRGQ